MTKSSLLNKQPKIVLDQRDRLYFNHWEYSFAFHGRNIQCLRGLPAHDLMLKTIRMRQAYAWYGAEITDEHIREMSSILSFFKDEPEPFKLVVSYNWASVYSNDPNFGSRLAAVSNLLTPRCYRRAVVAKPKDTVILADPKFKYRSYFKAQWFPDEKFQPLQDFFAAQQGQIEPCGAFKTFLRSQASWGRHWLPSHYYVEYDDPRYETMLALMMPRCFRKTMPVVKRINN